MDFNPDKYNKMQDTRSFPSSGLKAGVEDGLSSVQALSRGDAQPEQEFTGANFRKDEINSSGGSSKGKSFTFKV